MKRNLKVKLLIILAVLLAFAYGMVGLPPSWSPQGLREGMGQRISLGLDLRGGTHLILEVQVQDALRAEGNRALERLREDLRQANIAYQDVSMPDDKQPERLLLSGVPPEARNELDRIISDRLPEWELTSAPQDTYLLVMRPSERVQLEERAVAQAIETIRGRIDALGVAEPAIQEHGLGRYQILVQLPGVDDPARVKNIMQSTAMLEIRHVRGGPYSSESEAYAAFDGALPPGTVLLRGRSFAAGDTPGDAVWLLSRSAAVSGTQLRTAEPSRDEFGRPAVRFVLTAEGGRRFAAFTGANVGERLGVVLDNRVMNVATIQEQIRDEGRITGVGDQEARDLAMVLRSGALPAGIRYLEERTVGPSLGADSIRQGVTAALIGMFAVMVFMLVYYKGAGINANLALLLNLLILLGFLGFSGATLTLPGIAGVILTIGMAVDANVLVFERIREELRHGKTPAAAVEQGFSRAWLTVMDTNLTTIVAAFVLFIFGTGPVRGFAVTLTFGLTANLFTAFFVSRTIFDWILTRKGRGEALSI
jgi:preprotein translocase subunit SecD